MLNFPLSIIRALLPKGERDEILADLRAEYATRASAHGERAARAWAWRQALASVPPLLRWGWWREWTGFEPNANAYRPGGPVLRYLFSDIRYAARRLVKRPAYTVIAVLTLALGIGGTAAVFGVARPVLFDPLPYKNGKDVASFWMSGSWTEEEFVYLRGRIPGYSAVAAYRQTGITLVNNDEPARLMSGLETSTELFSVLGAAPVMGHDFQSGDDATGVEPVAMLSYGLWQELGANPAIVGTQLTIAGVKRTVVGVMPRAFWFPTPDTRLWIPRTLNPSGRNGSYTLLGRVLPGADPRHMEAPVTQLVTMLKERFTYDTDWDKTKNASVRPLRDVLLGPMRPALAATLIAMGLILLIACTNVSALMIGQVEGRATEMSVRAALGANRRRLTQPLIVEALLIGVLAAVAGSGIAAAGFGALAHALPIGAWADTARFDWTLFAVAFALAIGAVMLVSLVPSSSLWRPGAGRDLHGALSRARTGGMHGAGARMERGLVIVEVALAMLIVSGASLLVRSVSNLYAIKPGIDTHGVAVIDVATSPTVTSPQRQAAVNAMVAALGALPDVRSVAATEKLPLRGNGNSFGITIEGREQEARTNTFFRVVTNGYFETLGIRLVSGRVFDASTVARSGEIDVVINEALARKYFPGQDPLGRRVGGGFSVPQRIIGVVADVAEGALTDEMKPARYYSHMQTGWFGPEATLVIRTSAANPAVLLDAGRRTVNRIAPAYGVRQTTTMSRVLDQAVGPARQIMTLLALLSGLALVLGAVGIYGVIAHFVARRKRDWAIRVALGLSGTGVVTRILGEGAALVGVGVLLGAAGTIALSRVLLTLLYGIGRADPLSFVAAAAALIVTGLAAAFIPARRAGSVDPALVLRENA